jgi:hypothetical protein
VLFNIGRLNVERLTVSPTGVATTEEWGDQFAADAAYRARIHQFAKAFTFGGAPIAMEIAAEAILGIDCDIYEGFRVADQGFQTYADLEGFFAHYVELEDFTYGQLEGIDLGTDQPTSNRWQFSVVPKREITAEERRCCGHCRRSNPPTRS